jgi:hypothetical protein
MARNKISDLRDHLFAALERIDNDDLTADQISQEVNKAKAIEQCSLNEIGAIFGKDHATILHGIRMHEAWSLLKDKEYLKIIDPIREEFQIQMMEGFSKGDELRISLEDVFQDVASLNIKMKVNKAFIEKLPEIKTFQHLHDLYLELIE